MFIKEFRGRFNINRHAAADLVLRPFAAHFTYAERIEFIENYIVLFADQNFYCLALNCSDQTCFFKSLVNRYLTALFIIFGWPFGKIHFFGCLLDETITNRYELFLCIYGITPISRCSAKLSPDQVYNRFDSLCNRFQ